MQSASASASSLWSQLQQRECDPRAVAPQACLAVMGDVTPAHGTCRGGRLAAGSAGVQAGGRMRSCSAGQQVQHLTLCVCWLAHCTSPSGAPSSSCTWHAHAHMPGPRLMRCGVVCVAGACVSTDTAAPRVSSAYWSGACARLQQPVDTNAG